MSFKEFFERGAKCMLRAISEYNNLNISIKKLDDSSLKNISGGNGPSDHKIKYGLNWMQLYNRSTAGLVVGVIGTVGILGCSAAALTCNFLASKALNEGNNSKSAKLTKAAKSLGIAAAAFTAPTVGGFVAASLFKPPGRFIPTYDAKNPFPDPLLEEEKDNENALASL